jgi:hypothetical protein
MMLSVILAVIAAACFVSIMIALSVAVRLAEKLERAEFEIKRLRRELRYQHNYERRYQQSYEESQPLLWRVKWRGEVRSMPKMGDQEREFYDCQASVEAWGYALQVLRPWVDAARAIGSEELEWCMEHALEAATLEHARALDQLAELGVSD